jgi:hypothetical protein
VRQAQKKERTRFGEDGFETMLCRVTAIEKSLGIYAPAQVTPK